MSLTQLFFSFRGRIGRLIYWLGTIGILALFAAFASVNLEDGGIVGTPALILVWAFLIPALWGQLALSAKRLHDRGKSAWWMLLFLLLPSFIDLVAGQMGGETGIVLLLINVAIGGWYFVEVGLLPGIRGPNDYGPDPLQPASGTPA
jgi:uncharacterized membrane protein YhaH (DUF805 family)